MSTRFSARLWSPARRDSVRSSRMTRAMRGGVPVVCTCPAQFAAPAPGYFVQHIGRGRERPHMCRERLVNAKHYA